MAKDGLDKLSRLLVGGSKPPPQDEDDMDEEKLIQDAEKLLKQAELIAGKGASIFDVQILVDTAASLIRDQIREMVEEEDDD